MAAQDLRTRVHAHLSIGWTCIAVFVVLGTILEILHAWKVGLYLDVGNETRRLMWTLAHAHGTLLGLVHIAFAVTMSALGQHLPRVAGKALTGASVLLPLGFFLGGIWTHGGDPGLGVLLAPVGALFVLFAAVRTAIALRKLAPVPVERQHPRR